MKLYTEREITESLESMGLELMVNNFFQISEPIELPSEHKIEESSFKMSGNNVSPSSNFMIGAYWMKEQILNQNK
jgi:hypothetical protein